MVTISAARSADELETVTAIQLAVFSAEQGIPEDTCREGNVDAVHVLAWDGERAVATGRLLVGDGGTAELARIAVIESHRGNGIGADVVKALEQLARQSGIERVSLRPHRYLQPFYERLGYRYAGEPPVDVAGHVLITMSRSLSSGENA